MNKTGSKRVHMNLTQYIYIHCNIVYTYLYIVCLYMCTYILSSVRTNGLIARDPTFGGVPSLAAATRTQNINK